HEAEVPRALIAISDIGNISAGYRPSRPGDAGHDPPDMGSDAQWNENSR
ncbi:hypothetical protein JGD84_25445, partial [Salmonella enterica subsp. enterica serovar London]|nr:hypothetical protein [Salmonella enterica subsp. enterica serovar London]